MQIPKLVAKGLVIIAIPAMFQLFFGISLALMESRAEKAQQEERHSKEVLLVLGKVESCCYDISLNIIRLTVEKSVRIIKQLNATKEALDGHQKALTTLVSTDPKQSENAKQLKTVLSSFLEGTERIIDAIKDNDQTALTIAGIQMRRYALQSGAGAEQLKLMREVEEQRLAANPLNAERTQIILQTLMIGLICSTLIAIASAIYFLRDIVFRLYRISKNTELISLGQEMKPAMAGSDEIARLDQVLHSMARNLQEATKRETALVSNAADVILCLDKSLMISSINKAAENHWNYSNDDLLNKRLMQIVPAESQAEAHSFLSNARSKSLSESADIPIVCKNGQVRTFSWNVIWSADEELLFCVAHDVSELRRVESAKRDFVNMVSHDIRTPLSGMAIFLDMLDQGAYGNLNESGKSRAGSIGGALERIVAMVNDLLDIEKMQSGQFQIFKTEANVSEIVRASLEMVQGLAEMQLIKIEIESNGKIVFCDEARIIQVLQNLLSNAIKFSPANSKIILKVEQDEKSIKFAVKDHGSGISKSDLPTLFDKFIQARSEEQSKQSGFGLGLSICKDIIERHGGGIGVTSEIGQGSTFWFTLPKNTSHKV
ncbi:PAS domain S-box protein [bacterium]|nr:PAS domain S-box protein [bacterium]MBP9810911.1 PAS domain S-box protein [bacterium]